MNDLKDFLNRNKYIIAIVLIVISIIFYFFFDPTKYSIMPKCPVKLLTAFSCPGCGFQRALHAALHWNFIEAVHYNLFLLVAIPLTCIWFFNSLIIEYTSRQEYRLKILNRNRIIVYTYLICYSCWFVIRNIYKI